MKLKIQEFYTFLRSRLKVMWVFLAFIVFLLAAPEITKLTVPCMRPIPGNSYDSRDCTMDIVFSHYLLLVLIIFASVVISVFCSRIIVTIKELIVFAVFLGILVVAGFHLSIAGFERTIGRAPILLLDEKATQPMKTK